MPFEAPPPPDHPPEPRLVAVTGGKGGSGKTTTTLGVAAASARAGAPTLAVDADVDMPNLHLLAGVEREPTLQEGPPEQIAQRPDDYPGLDVATAPSGVDGLDHTGLWDCRRTYHRVFVDCPAGAGAVAAAPLRAADAALVVTTLEPACLEDALRTAEMARALGTAVAGVVLSRAESVPDALASSFDAPVLASVPVVDDPLEAPPATPAYRSVATALARESRAAGRFGARRG